MNRTKFARLITLPVLLIVVMLSPLSGRAQAPYFQAVTNLHPVAYWPMHDVEAPAPGDIETNYGSAGPLANGYYGDWVAPVSIIHNFSPGVIVADSDPCVSFNYIYPTGSGVKGSPTNCLIIPRTSPASTLIPPFSVECWFLFTNNINSGKQGDIWSSVNANVGLNGAVTYSGIRLFFNNNLSIFAYNATNVSSSGGAQSGNTAVTIPFNNGVWHHFVVTDDGTNINLYVDGLAGVTNFPNSDYAPNYGDPFEIDTGKGFTRDSSGLIDEFAIYTNALSVTDITNHYYTALNPSPAVPYKTLVMNGSPSIYFRMNSPTYVPPATASLPALVNYGNAPVNGVYSPGTMPAAVPGPNNGNAFAAGFGAGTNAMPGNGMSSFADAGQSSTWNVKGTNAFTMSAWFQADPADGRIQTILGHGGTNSWGLVLAVNGHLQSQLGTNITSALTSANIYNDGNWHQVVDVYSPASVPTVTGTNLLYVDGVLDASISTVGTNGIGPGTNIDVMIGSDAIYTNNPVALGRQFAGNICEVALFTNALTTSQIQNLYNSAQLPPYITTQPVSATVNQGAAFTNTVAARGGLPLSYQWYTNGVAIGGQTSASLIINPVQSSSAGNYYVVVTNNYGSVTSVVVSLTINSSPSLIAQYPVAYTNVFTLYSGANPTFSVVAGGAQPLTYFWTTNGVLDGMATNASVTLSDVQVGSINAKCIVSNFVSTITSMVWSASVIVDPPNPIYGGLAPYPQAVLALNPIGYWRMNESDDTLNDGNTNVVCHDYAGGNDALYTNVNLGLTGYSTLGVDGESAVQVGSFTSTFSLASWVGPNIDFSIPNGGNGEFSVETWVSLTKNSTAGQPQGGGIVCKGPPNSGEEFVLETASGGPFRFSVRNAAGTQYTAAAANNPTLNTFYHVVGVCDQVHGTIALYVNGQLAGQTTIPAGTGIVNGNGIPMTMGARTPGAAAISSQSFGFLNDVALFGYPLSSNQVLNEYLQAGFAPYFTQNPTNSAIVASGSNVVVTATALGTTPLGFQWFDTNNVGVAGQTNASLDLSSVTAGGTYYLQATNFYGTANSSLVTVTVYIGPYISSYLPLTYTNLFTLYSGASPKFSIQAVNLQNGQPLFFQWYGNGAGIGGATGSNLSSSSQPPGGFANYYCVASNLLGATTSFVWSASVVVPPTNPYPQAVLSLRPMGYWRLDETDDGDGDFNAGLVAHDYIAGNDGQYTNMYLGGVGYSAPGSYSPYDGDFLAAYFGAASTVSSGAFGILGADFGAVSGSSVAFSVEAWAYGYTQTKDAGIVAKGYGGAEQFSLDTGSDGGSPSHAFRFLVRGSGGTSYAVNSSVTPGATWHHLVGVCDQPHGQVILYIDGQPVGTNAIPTNVGIQASTVPMSIGSRASSAAAVATNAYDNQFGGYINDVAVFNYALTAAEITNEFQGIPSVLVNQNPTNIVFSVSGNQLTLGWPADHTGWQLQVQTNGPTAGLGTNWVTIPSSTSTNQVVIPVDPAKGNVFYRLVYPPSP